MNFFRPSTFARARRNERGVTIILIAVGMLFLILAISAIAIDVGAMYSARGEAKHAADAAAMAGAKVLANSGMTSDPTDAALQTAAVALATQIATSVGTQNKVGGRDLVAGEVAVSYPNFGTPSFVITPQVKVIVQRTDLPTFFSKAWGTSTVAVGATSTAEAVNPSDSGTVTASGFPAPIATQCVKPWLIPNLDPNHGGSPFFIVSSGHINFSGQVGTTLRLTPACPAAGCAPGSPPNPTIVGAFVQYVQAAMTGPLPSEEPASCTLGCNYEENIAACSPEPIACGISPNAAADFSNSCTNYNSSTHSATQCLVHSGLGADTITLSQPMRFRAGDGNPLVVAGKLSTGDPVTVSDSLVTIPVYDGTPLVPAGTSAPVNVIGFIQGFVKNVLPNGRIFITIVNISGCGAGATGPPIVGNGLSPVPVHLITPP